MTKRAAILFACGVFVAIALAAWQYAVAPEGTLLYTPAPGVKPNYTPSALIGFFLGTLASCAVSLFTAFVSLIGAVLFDRRLFKIAKQASLLGLGFGLLCVLTLLSDPLWR
jgi:hypothetical protein